MAISVLGELERQQFNSFIAETYPRLTRKPAFLRTLMDRETAQCIAKYHFFYIHLIRMIRILYFLAICLLPGSIIAQRTTYDEFVDSLQHWIDIRVTNAAEGIEEHVEMPFVVRSLGWGCMCPDHYLGVSPFVQEGPFIHPLVPDNFPVSDHDGHSLIVRGYFTGRHVDEDFRDENGEPEEWLYTLPEFKIESWEKNDQEYEVAAPFILTERE